MNGWDAGRRWKMGLEGAGDNWSDGAVGWVRLDRGVKEEGGHARL